jgi:hypothetical protein
MTKTMNHIIFFFLHQNQNIFLEKNHNPPLQVKWSFPNVKPEICDDFVYLGLLFHYHGSFLHTQKSLSNQGRKALFNLYSKIHDDCFNHETLMSLFDTYISSILSYGCETWGSLRN